MASHLAFLLGSMNSSRAPLASSSQTTGQPRDYGRSALSTTPFSGELEPGVGHGMGREQESVLSGTLKGHSYLLPHVAFFIVIWA